MAKDAFALSPISARAVQPSEEDYEAISEAFMETARGRWFLGEYARRNRNADTRMVLDAVARIEQSLTSQQQPRDDGRFADALTAIKAVVDEARNAASAAIEGLALQPTLAPVRKGARIMKEISWRWREIGADGRICDLIDAQVATIEASCEQLGAGDPLTALGAAFDLIDRRLAQFREPDQAPVAAGEVTPAAAAESTTAASPAHIETEQAGAPAGARSEASAPTTAIPETATAGVTAGIMAAGPAEPAADPATEADAESVEMSAEAADAHDEAVLDMIAMEMAVVEPPDDDERASPVAETTAPAGESPVPAMAAPEPEPPAVRETASAQETAPRVEVENPAAASIEQPAPTRQPLSPAMEPAPTPLPPVVEAVAEPASAAQNQPSPEALAQAILEASPELSLGSAIVASGIIRKPISASDPLAALRRLTQAEKIALFS